MLPRRYEIVSIRPAACELLVRYIEGDHEIVLNLTPPSTEKDLHRHVLRHWPSLQFRTMQVLKKLASTTLRKGVDVSASDVERFGLEEIDE